MEGASGVPEPLRVKSARPSTEKRLEWIWRNVGEIEIVSGQVETKGAGRGIVSGAAGDDGIVVEEMDVIECKFAVGEMEAGIELLNGLTVGGGVGEMDLSFAVRIGEAAGGLDGKIGVAGDGIVVSGERLEVSEIGVVEVGVDREGAVAGEMAVFERGGGVEFGGSVVAAQSGVAQSDGLEGKLERGGKRIPMCVERWVLAVAGILMSKSSTCRLPAS